MPNFRKSLLCKIRVTYIFPSKIWFVLWFNGTGRAGHGLKMSAFSQPPLVQTGIIIDWMIMNLVRTLSMYWPTHMMISWCYLYSFMTSLFVFVFFFFQKGFLVNLRAALFFFFFPLVLSESLKLAGNERFQLTHIHKCGESREPDFMINS